MTTFSAQPPGAVKGAVYQLDPHHRPPKGGLRRVRVSRCTASRVYFHDPLAVNAADTVNFSLPARTFQTMFRRVCGPAPAQEAA